MYRTGIIMFFLSSIFLLALSTFFFVIIRLEFEIYNNEQPEDFTVSTDYVEFVYGGCLYASIILIIINWILVYFMWQEKFDISSMLTVAFPNEKIVQAQFLMPPEDRHRLYNCSSIQFRSLLVKSFYFRSTQKLFLTKILPHETRLLKSLEFR